MVLRAVAEPPQIFWAPLLPAGGNVMFNFVLMVFGTLFFKLNPIPFFVTLLIGHAFIAAYALRDPHLSNLMIAWIETRRKTTNLFPTRGNKYVP